MALRCWSVAIRVLKRTCNFQTGSSHFVLRTCIHTHVTLKSLGGLTVWKSENWSCYPQQPDFIFQRNHEVWLFAMGTISAFALAFINQLYCGSCVIFCRQQLKNSVGSRAVIQLTLLLLRLSIFVLKLSSPVHRSAGFANLWEPCYPQNPYGNYQWALRSNFIQCT